MNKVERFRAKISFLLDFVGPVTCWACAAFAFVTAIGLFYDAVKTGRLEVQIVIFAIILCAAAAGLWWLGRKISRNV